MRFSLRKVSTVLLLMIMLVGTYDLLSSSALNADPLRENPIGKDIASRFKAIAMEHQGIIEDFILETNLQMETSQEGRLTLLETKLDELRSKVEEVNKAREELIEKLKAGEITGEEFAMEMQMLAMELGAVATSMGTLGDALSEMNQEMAEDLRDRAQRLAEELQSFAEELAETGREIADEMSKRGFELPELPPTAGTTVTTRATTTPRTEVTTTEVTYTTTTEVTDVTTWTEGD